MSNSKQENNLLLHAVSLAAFVGITAFSQWLHHTRRKTTAENVLSFPSASPETVTKEDMQGETDATWERIYRQRRRERLSFHEISERENSDYWTDSDGSSTSSDDAPLHQFQSNWSHFERYNQEESLTVVSGASSSKKYSNTAQRHVFRTISGSYEDADQFYSPNLDSGESNEDIHPLLSNPSRGGRTSSSPALHLQNELQSDKTTSTMPPKPQGKIQKPDVNGQKVGTSSQTLSTSRSLSMPPEKTATALRRTDTHSTTDVQHARTSSHHSIQLQNRVARTHYNAQIMPQKVILLRHGQSMGNIDENYYSTTPDNAMPLTELGWKQAKTAGKHLKEQLLGKAGNVHFIISPYVRTVETFHGIVSAWCDPDEEFGHIVDRKARLKAWYSRLLELGLSWREDPRIREQDFGNYQKPSVVNQCKKERAQFGAFYFRFPNGESGADVFDRISTFLDSLWRSFDIHKSRHYVLITHGIAIRVLLTRYYRYTIDQFHLLANPKNCEMVVLEHDQRGRLILSGRHELTNRTKDDEEELCYEFFPRLRVLPDEYVRTAKCRMSYNDQV